MGTRGWLSAEARGGWLALLLVSGAGFAAFNTVSAEEREGRFFGAEETELPAWFKESFLDFEEDIGEAAENDRRLMVFFHQAGCPYCNALVEHNFAQKDILETTRRHFDVVAINMWGDREVVTVGGQEYTEKRFAEALRVHYTPTLLFFTEDGGLALRLNGYYPPGEFRLALEYASGRHGGAGSFRDFVAARNPPASSGTLTPQPFFSRPPHDLDARDGRAKRPLAVLFEQKQCPNCEVFHEKVLGLPETRELLARFQVVQLDMWSDTPLVTPDGQATTARQWARELGVNYAPSLVVFDRDGGEAMRTDAFLKSFHTQSVLDYVLTGAYRTEPSFQRYLQARAEHIREQGKDVHIWR